MQPQAARPKDLQSAQPVPAKPSSVLSVPVRGLLHHSVKAQERQPFSSWLANMAAATCDFFTGGGAAMCRDLHAFNACDHT